MIKLNSFSIVSLVLLALIMSLDIFLLSIGDTNSLVFLSVLNLTGLYVLALALFSNPKTK